MEKTELMIVDIFIGCLISAIQAQSILGCHPDDILNFNYQRCPHITFIVRVK